MIPADEFDAGDENPDAVTDETGDETAPASRGESGDQRLPRIVDRRGVKQTLEPGVYHWCRCGRSQSQPFCDGSHEGTGFEPVRFEITGETRTVRLCLCKHSSHPPYCDGSHFAV